MSEKHQINKYDLTLSEKISYWVILPIFSIVLYVGSIIFITNIQTKRDNEFKAEINTIIENNELTEFQIEKIQYYLIIYMRSEDTSHIPIEFSSYIKTIDFDFWYEIKFIFEGD